MKTSSEIRNDFLQFFREKEHLIVNSVPVVPADDPTLLFINAGMNPFKPIFLGEEDGIDEGGKRWKRAADTQKCIRVSGKHNDLEEVGIDTYHHTLFEMLGNWSFGDYFKEEAIAWAWELLVDRWGLDPDRLYATVFEGDKADGLPVDQESIALWKEKTGIHPDHILKYGKKDNFWEMGDTGPCGPCSEIHIDLRSDEERQATPGADLVNAGHPQVMEIWNLVFIQFNRRKDGSLESLPAVHVDTGMGFERICAVLQGKNSNYDSDLFAPLLTAIGVLGNVVYGKDESTDIAMRVIADHIRAVTFAIADGASPSNEGRGYVIRRILRRAIRYGWDQLQLREPFMHSLVDVLGTQFQEIFPEVQQQSSYIKNVIRAEETSFLKTLGQGIELFTEMTRGKQVLSGEDAFKLHDTYGFPIDLTELMAREKGIRVDTDTFEQKMEEQRARARASGSFAAGEHEGVSWFFRRDAGAPFVFTGYDRLTDSVTITAAGTLDKTFVVMLDRSPFYAESGGQVADRGTIQKGDEVIQVLDVQKSAAGNLHVVDRLPEAWLKSGGADADEGARVAAGADADEGARVAAGADADAGTGVAAGADAGTGVAAGADADAGGVAGAGVATGAGVDVGSGADVADLADTDALAGWLANVDPERRAETEKHHSATHLLHAALRSVLGDHVAQKGSLVAPDRLRFDFSHFQAVKEEELAEVEEMINKKIQANIPLQEERDLAMEQAKERGAMMLFGEKYGDRVRMITFDPGYSVELCGGTHVSATGSIGYFRFVQETSVASGIRRVEAVTGMAADQLLRKEHQTVREVTSLLGSGESISDGILSLIDKNKALEKELDKLRQREAAGALDQLLQRPVSVGDVTLYRGEMKGADMNVLKQQGYEALKKTESRSVIVLGSRDDTAGKVYLMAAVTEDLVAAGVKAGALVSDLGKIVGGGGGGQPTLATAGGRFPEKLTEALDAAKEWVENIPKI